MIKILFGLFISTFAFEIKVDQDIELTHYMNARYSARFTKEDKNIASVLPKGIQGTVREIKTFSSGNSGFFIAVKNGELKGQNVWVYYNEKSPSLKLLDEKQQPTKEPVQAYQVQTLRATTVLKEPVTASSALDRVGQATQNLAKLSSDAKNSMGGCTGCNQHGPGESGGSTGSASVIATSQSADGNLNARIKCSYKGDSMIHAGSIQLNIENNQVKYIDVTIRGCRVDSQKFKQIYFANKNIVLEDSNGCRVVITDSLKVRGSHSPVVSFNMVPTYDCVKSCAKVDKKFWQVEMNPNTKTCY